MPYSDFFLGAGSPTGFVGYFNHLTEPDMGIDVTLIKAGPGCGKSTFMRNIAIALNEKGCFTELIHCSSDSDSLDGVICQEKNFAIIDATAPHIVEPKYPGAVEDVLSLYHLLDRQKLGENKEEIVALFAKNSCYHERATRYITAAGSLVQDSMRVAGFCLDSEKIDGFCKRFCAKKIAKSSTEGKAKEHLRVLGAITPKGHVFYGNTISAMAQEVVVIEDSYGCVAKKILSEVKNAALAKNYDIYTCYCAMSPYDKIEHIIIPELSLAVTTRNNYNEYEFGNVEVIKNSRFLRTEQLRERKKRLKFNKTTTEELLEQAVLMLKKAKSVHDDIEVHYVAAMDFGKLSLMQHDFLVKL